MFFRIKMHSQSGGLLTFFHLLTIKKPHSEKNEGLTPGQSGKNSNRLSEADGRDPGIPGWDGKAVWAVFTEGAAEKKLLLIKPMFISCPLSDCYGRLNYPMVEFY